VRALRDTQRGALISTGSHSEVEHPGIPADQITRNQFKEN
jgi:hypothetical protein